MSVSFNWLCKQGNFKSLPVVESRAIIMLRVATSDTNRISGNQTTRYSLTRKQYTMLYLIPYWRAIPDSILNGYTGFHTEGLYLIPYWRWRQHWQKSELRYRWVLRVTACSWWGLQGHRGKSWNWGESSETPVREGAKGSENVRRKGENCITRKLKIGLSWHGCQPPPG